MGTLLAAKALVVYGTDIFWPVAGTGRTASDYEARQDSP
jgi:hypothetical protein